MQAIGEDLINLSFGYGFNLSRLGEDALTFGVLFFSRSETQAL